MKSILLASASVFAFAGAAAAEVSFSGDTKLGYNEDDGPTTNGFPGDDEFDGFYWEGNLAVALSQELDNGLTAGATFDFDFVTSDGTGTSSLGDSLDAGGYTVFIESDTASLTFGDTTFAAENRWVSAGDMEQDAFSEADGEAALRGDMTYGNIEGSISYVIANNADTYNASEDLNQLSLGASADFGGVNVVMAYQAESDEAAGFYSGNGDFTDDEIFGLSAGTTFAGADVRVAYATNQTADEDSIGIEGSYPFGPVTASAYFVAESMGDDNFGVSVDYSDGPIAVTASYADEQGTDIAGVEGSYDVGNGLMVMAGYLTEEGTEDRFYVAGDYDLGSGAALLVSYAEDDDNVDGDEIGGPEYQRGTTVEVSFDF
ncbi:porin [Salibaculum halophilum]|uniref:porin n=1 Tax=Salibaculum halophilum TaxID=1914408 RepID=UPI000A0FFF05|nr:porin [Salibaculum halophilum]